MRVLVDTGILLRLFDRSAPDRQQLIFEALRRLWSGRHQLATTAQNVAEFWNVSTRPTSARGGYGLPVSVVEQRVRAVERLVEVLPFSRRAYEEWRRLLSTYQVTGVSVHDARIAATMIDANIAHILTMNEADFRRYSTLVVLTPETIGNSLKTT